MELVYMNSVKNQFYLEPFYRGWPLLNEVLIVYLLNGSCFDVDGLPNASKTAPKRKESSLRINISKRI